MVWVVRFIVLFVIFMVFDIAADYIDEEKIGWFGWFCFLIGQFYEMIPWDSLF